MNDTVLSPVHAMLGQIERRRDAIQLNRIVNDPSVYRWVKGYMTGRMDLTNVVTNPNNILLMGEHGGVIFAMHQHGLYEAHTQVLPAGRGKWALFMVRAALHWMFTHTIAMEIMTRCPHGNLPALALAKSIGGHFEFTNPRGWIMDLDPIPADVYALTVQDWLRTAPGLVERGRMFHAKLNEEYARLGKTPKELPDDEAHDRYVGAMAEMIIGGQPDKGVMLYNRFAALASYGAISIISRMPLTLDIGDALVIVRDTGDVYAALAA